MSIKDVKQLSFDEKLILMEEIWDGMIGEAAQKEIPRSHLKLIRKRIKTLDRSRMVTWEEIKEKARLTKLK